MSELLEALSHEGDKDRQIEQLLQYLHFDETTKSHRDWVADCQTYEARIAALESFVQFVGNALDLHDDETDLGIEFRKLLVPTLETKPKPAGECGLANQPICAAYPACPCGQSVLRTTSKTKGE